MAKKQQRSGKPVPGGRVTPKGVRPNGSSSRTDDQAQMPAAPRPVTPPRTEPGHSGPPINQHAPTRAGHHRGQR